jgi:alkaline phosphatase
MGIVTGRQKQLNKIESRGIAPNIICQRRDFMNKPDNNRESGDGISRRNALKIIGAGALYSVFPSGLSASILKEFEPSKARGLIFVVGDGMPLGVIKAMHEMRVRFNEAADTNIYSRMKDENSAVGLMGTKSLSSIVTDSAPASVAWATGSKTANRLLSALPDGRPLKTILEIAKENGYATGLVTTTRVTHATPAAWISHQMHRDLEDAIALDYLKFRPEVLLGGGSAQFSPSTRKDGRDLFREFANSGFDVSTDKGSLLSMAAESSSKPLLGLFNSSHISYYVDRMNDAELNIKQPDLAEMTSLALKRLSANSKGFILQVEAGRIDHASHSNDAWAAINDMYEMDVTLGVIEEYLKINPNTLVIVTSDHGNSGWGINGTGPDYNDSTEALKKYMPIKASFEIMTKQMKGKTAAEIRDIFDYHTTYKLSEDEASVIHESMQPDYQSYPGDFIYLPDALLGKALAHSIYRKNREGVETASLRRGNIGFTSTNHTAEDQIVLTYGYEAKQLGLNRYIDNTYLFNVMCRFMGVKYKNPSMTEEQAKPHIKTTSVAEWNNHMKLHIA